MVGDLILVPITPDVLDALDVNLGAARSWDGWKGIGFIECVEFNVGLLEH